MKKILILLLFSTCTFFLTGQNVIDVLTNEKQQVIDGFGAHQGNADANQNWWLDLFYNDLRASIYRVSLTPRLVAPYSDLHYYSPWFLGNGNEHPLNIEHPSSPGGPEKNRVRTYTSPDDYGRDFGGYNAPIAVMGPDIDVNVQSFTYATISAIGEGHSRAAELGDFKLIGSIWSPLPWLKISSGNSWSESWWPGPVQGTPWPFIWGGNFAGGRLDVSNQPLDVFDDSALGGEGPTSALTQFARSTAAYIRGYQNFHNTKFYAISIQNELNFEEFYESATYPISLQYILALNAIRKEFDNYDDLKDIKLMGPEDVLGGDAYGMWQYGSGDETIHKNLQYLKQIALNNDASAALDFFSIHGYATDGSSASGEGASLWNWWVNGWEQSPAAGIPSNVKGFASFGKKSWMTETSGEHFDWLYPTGSFPNGGAWGLALRMHYALTAGQQSAWLYWTFTEADDNNNVHTYALTTEGAGTDSPKYVAAKHYFRYIRPDAYRVSCEVNATGLLGSAYTHEADSTVTVILLNTAAEDKTVAINLHGVGNENMEFESYTSNQGSFWQNAIVDFENGSATINLPPYSVLTLFGHNALLNATDELAEDLPIQFFESQPNPFSGKSKITFKLSEREKVQITLFNSQGKLVDTLLNEVRSPGAYEVEVDGATLAEGWYLCKLQAGSFERVIKLVVVKRP